MTTSPALSQPNISQEAQKACQREIKKLDLKRQSLELESQVIVDELTAQPEEGGLPMGIDTPLVDSDGYPRADIDVYRARNLRKRLAEIRTDHKEIMKKIESGLKKLATFAKPSNVEKDKAELDARKAAKPKPKFDPVTGKWVVKNWDGTVAGVENGDRRNFDNLTSQSPALSVENDSTSTEPMEVENRNIQLHVPFAIIDSVFPSSPADAAGLHEDDLLVRFGTADHTNHRNLKAIAELVPDAAAEQREIPVTLLRKKQMNADNDANSEESSIRQKIFLKLLPKPWAGRGMLGCHIKQYTDTSSYDEPC